MDAVALEDPVAEGAGLAERARGAGTTCTFGDVAGEIVGEDRRDFLSGIAEDSKVNKSQTTTVPKL